MADRSSAEHRVESERAVALAETMRSACLDAALRAYEDARIRGLCEEGAWEAAVGAIRSVDASEVVRRTNPHDARES